MAERYTTIYKLDGMYYAESSPVLISAGALRLSTMSNALFVQLKLTNLDERVLRSVCVSIHPLDSDDQENRGSVEYTYEELDCERDNSFGKNTAIYMPDAAVRSFYVQIKSVTFGNGDVWDGSDCKYEKLPPPKTLEEALGDDDVAHQFQISYGSDCVYMPSEEKDIWFCTCGAINGIAEAKCHRCRRVYNTLKSINISTLRSESSHRLESEKKIEEEEDLELSEKRGKLKKLLLILVPSFLIVVVAIALIAGSAARKNAYAHAEELLKNRAYDEAALAFEQLGDYNDCAELALHEVPYQKALYVMQCAESEDTDALVMLDMKRSELPEGESVGTALYRKAAEMFKALGDYKDSVELAGKSEKAVEDLKLAALDERYRAAAASLDEKDYCEARDAFKALGEYKDSALMADEAIYRMASSLSGLSEKYAMEGISCKLSLVSGEKSVFYIPQEVFKGLGGISTDIRSLFAPNTVEINFEDAPDDEEVLPFDEALCALFATLGEYKDSAEHCGNPVDPEAPVEQTVSEASNDSSVFFNYCASGDLASAYQWLSDHSNEFQSCDMWMNILNLYIPFCGTWNLEQGDPVLISSIINVTAPCNTFASVVQISKDGSAKLCIYPEGNSEYPILLNSEFSDDGSICFTASPDGIQLYYAVINNVGHFNISKYNIYAQKQKNDSCSYVKQ